MIQGTCTQRMYPDKNSNYFLIIERCLSLIIKLKDMRKVYGILQQAAFFILVMIVFSHSVFAQAKWKEISAGSEFSMAIQNDGSLWTWGFNGNGGMGIEGVTSINYPIQVGTDNDWSIVSAGGVHSMGIKEDGSLWGWGFNGVYSTGVDVAVDIVTSPTQVGSDTDWVAVDAGYAHCLGIKADGSLWGWGFNIGGQVTGNGQEAVRAPLLLDGENTWVQVEAGGLHSLALTSEGHIYSWGYNGEGQLGNGTLLDKGTPSLIDSANTYLMIAAGIQANYAVRSDSTLWAWGFNGNKELGTQPDLPFSDRPIQVGSDNDWVLVKSGSVYGVGFKEGGVLYAWGSNLFGQLGAGSAFELLEPTKIGDESWNQISPATGIVLEQGIFGGHTLGLKDDDSVICATGANYIGQLGDTTTIDEVYFTCNTGALISTAFANVGQQLDIQLYPNPTSGELTVEIPELTSTDATVSILNGVGAVVHSEVNAQSKMKLYLSDMPDGMYFLLVRDGAEVHSRKFMIVR